MHATGGWKETWCDLELMEREPNAGSSCEVFLFVYALLSWGTHRWKFSKEGETHVYIFTQAISPSQMRKHPLSFVSPKLFSSRPKLTTAIP